MYSSHFDASTLISIASPLGAAKPVALQPLATPLTPPPIQQRQRPSQPATNGSTPGWGAATYDRRTDTYIYQGQRYVGRHSAKHQFNDIPEPVELQQYRERLAALNRGEGLPYPIDSQGHQCDENGVRTRHPQFGARLRPEIAERLHGTRPGTTTVVTRPQISLSVPVAACQSMVPVETPVKTEPLPTGTKPDLGLAKEIDKLRWRVALAEAKQKTGSQDVAVVAQAAHAANPEAHKAALESGQRPAVDEQTHRNRLLGLCDNTSDRIRRSLFAH